jgi:hypothetical protein
MNKFWKITTVINFVVVIIAAVAIGVSANTGKKPEIATADEIETIEVKVIERPATPDEAEKPTKTTKPTEKSTELTTNTKPKTTSATKPVKHKNHIKNKSPSKSLKSNTYSYVEPYENHYSGKTTTLSPNKAAKPKTSPSKKSSINTHDVDEIHDGELLN